MATEIELVVTATSNIDKKMAEAEKSVKKVETQTEKSTKNMESKWKGLGNVIQGVMGSMIIKQGSELIKSSERQSIALEILKVKSKDVYNQLQETSDATFGLANKFDMVTAANKAMAFGINLSGGRLKDLMKISSKLALVMGIETKQAFDDLITSSARQQKLIADNLGVMIDKVAVDEAYAEQLGKTRIELTEMEQSQAFLNEILKKGAVITGDITDEFVKMNTQGTKAIKTLETAWSTTLNTIAKGFVWFGTQIGEEFAKKQGYRVKDIREGDKEYKDYYDRLKKLEEGRSSAYQHIHKQYMQTTEKTVIQNYDTWVKYYKAKKLLEKRGVEDDKKLQKEIQRRNEEFADDGVWVDGRIVSSTYIDTSMKRMKEITSKNLKETKTKKGKKSKSNAGTDIMGGLVGLWEDTKEFADEQYYKAALWQDDKINTEKERMIRADTDLRSSLFNQQLSWEQQVEKAEKDSLKRREAQSKKYFGMMQGYGSEYLSAIITGQLDAIPQILANQAMMFGQELFWDGLKTLWMGTAQNALFPGIGASAMSVGVAEMGIGAGLMAAGGVASNAMASAPPPASSGSKERNNESAGNGTINMNVTTSLYGSKTQAKKELVRTMR